MTVAGREALADAIIAATPHEVLPQPCAPIYLLNRDGIKVRQLSAAKGDISMGVSLPRSSVATKIVKKYIKWRPGDGD